MTVPFTATQFVAYESISKVMNPKNEYDPFTHCSVEQTPCGPHLLALCQATGLKERLYDVKGSGNTWLPAWHAPSDYFHYAEHCNLLVRLILRFGFSPYLIGSSVEQTPCGPHLLALCQATGLKERLYDVKGSGNPTTLCMTVPFTATQFVAYESISKVMNPKNEYDRQGLVN
jgi:hypothetical protein